MLSWRKATQWGMYDQRKAKKSILVQIFFYKTLCHPFAPSWHLDSQTHTPFFCDQKNCRQQRRWAGRHSTKSKINSWKKAESSFTPWWETQVYIYCIHFNCCCCICCRNPFVQRNEALVPVVSAGAWNFLRAPLAAHPCLNIGYPPRGMLGAELLLRPACCRVRTYLSKSTFVDAPLLVDGTDHPLYYVFGGYLMCLPS